MTTTYLYILQDADSDHVKIGISDDVHRRIIELPDNIDQTRSFYAEFPTRKAAYSCEKFIHASLGMHNERKAHRRVGSTEWFRAAAKQHAIDFVNNNKAFVMCASGMQPLPVRPVPSTESRATLQANKAAELEARRASRAAQMIEENARLVQNAVTELENIRRSGRLVGLAGHILVLRTDTPIEPLYQMFRASLKARGCICGLFSPPIPSHEATYLPVVTLYPGDAEAEHIKSLYSPRPVLEKFEALLASLPKLEPMRIEDAWRTIRESAPAASGAHHSEPAPQPTW